MSREENLESTCMCREKEEIDIYAKWEENRKRRCISI
jgi:hypothetical protein